MIPGGMVAWWLSRYLPGGRRCEASDMHPCDACLMALDRARHDLMLIVGPRLEAEVIVRRAEALIRLPLAPTERAEAEAVHLRAREVIAGMERAARGEGGL